MRRLLMAAAGGLLVVAGCSSGAGSATNTSPPHNYQPKAGDLLYYTNASISYNSEAKHPWVVVIDAKTKQIVAASEIGSISSSPHGLGVSPDGRDLYLPAGIGSPIPALGPVPGGVKFGNGMTVIDAVTLKVTQSIETKDAPHHVTIIDDSTMMFDAWGTKQVLGLLDTSKGNAITQQLAAQPFGGRPYIGFPSPDGKYIYETVRPPAGSTATDAWISRVSLADFSVEKIATVGPGAVWTAFSRDGKYAYVTVPEDDWVVKVDLDKREIVGKSATGRGPYGATLTPDEKHLLVVSKGEAGRGQRGATFVVISADNMQLLEERPACREYVCQPDHVVNSPDGREFWISNNMGYISVFDQKTLAMKAEIAMPLRGDPHGGVFVQYDRTGKGHVVMDLGGPHGGVSPYLFDNANGIPTLATALAGGWAAAKTSSALAAGTVRQGVANANKVTVEVIMDDFFFAPRDLTIPAGAEVTFKIVNKGQAAHNFLSKDLGIEPFDVKAGGTGQLTWKGTTKTGTFKYVCSYHPGMEGTITVR